MREGRTIADVLEGRADWVVVTGDCLEVLPKIPAGAIDATVCDPPYGVGFQYASHDDSPTDYAQWRYGWFTELRRVTAGPILVSCGMANLCQWPQADWVLCWHKPAAMGRCFVGFNNWEPVLVYGRLRAGQTVDVFAAPIVPDPSIDGHPCPKPLAWGMETVRRASVEGDIVLDCFGGSGTTAVAAVRTGRRAILIEKDPGYADIARRRIREAEPVLFTQAKQQQMTLTDESTNV